MPLRGEEGKWRRAPPISTQQPPAAVATIASQQTGKKGQPYLLASPKKHFLCLLLEQPRLYQSAPAFVLQKTGVGQVLPQARAENYHYVWARNQGLSTLGQAVEETG